MPQLPQYLGHKPIIEDAAYQQKDARFYNSTTDAEAISLGKAIYDETEISAKMWRYGNNKWSRQSEELPLHRVLDMAIFIVNNLKSISNPSLINSEASESPQIIRNYYNNNRLEFDRRISEIESAIQIFKSTP